MSTPPISIQLYTLREDSADNFDKVLEKVALLGFKGVEPFNLFGKTPAAFKQQVNDLGMEVSSTHFPWANRSQSIQQIVDVISALDLTRAPGGFGPDDFKDMDAVKRSIETTQNLVDGLKPHGISLFLHNHYWEYDLIDGRPGYHYLQDAVPEVEFEIDTYWAANFGQRNPAEEVQRVRNRVPLMHIKDGPLVPDEAHLPVGSGKMDFPSILAAADPQVFEWAVVELDRCDCDMWVAVAQSYQFLTNNNLATGNV